MKVLKAPAKRWIEEAALVIKGAMNGQGVQTMTRDVRVEMHLFLKNLVPRDLDNYRKALYDSMTMAGVFNDDCQIVQDPGFKYLDRNCEMKVVVNVIELETDVFGVKEPRKKTKWGSKKKKPKMSVHPYDQI